MRAPFYAKNKPDEPRAENPKRVRYESGFADNRQVAAAQRKMVEILDNRPHLSKQLALDDAIHEGPRMVSQSYDLKARIGVPLQRRTSRARTAGESARHNESAENVGLPKQLKSGIESLSGMSMDHVKVHYRSVKPAQLRAHAFAQGDEIHLGAGQEKHLPHEAWHVVQQAQGRVRPTLHINEQAINDDAALENEADMMGSRAAQFAGARDEPDLVTAGRAVGTPSQRVAGLSSPTLRNPPWAVSTTAILDDNQTMSRQGSTIAQGKFIREGKQLTLAETLDWFNKLPSPDISLGEDNHTILTLLSNFSTPYSCDEYLTRQQFKDFLNIAEADYRPVVSHYDEDGTEVRQPLPGKLTPDGTSLDGWTLGKSAPHTAADADKAQETTTLVHVTHNTDGMDGNSVDTHRGESGEFQAGLYLVSGHHVQPAEKIRDQWSSDTKKYTKVIHFQIPNSVIQAMSGSTDEEHRLIIHMLQQPSGYPDNNAGAALALMNQINAKGKVLLFPDNKDQEVVIDGAATKKSWNKFVDGERSNGDHMIVIGPQKPPKLDGVRQIALRGSYANVLVNSAPRRLQTMAPPSTGTANGASGPSGGSKPGAHGKQKPNKVGKK